MGISRLPPDLQTFSSSKHAGKLTISDESEKLYWKNKRVMIVPLWIGMLFSVVTVIFAVTGFIAALMGIYQFLENKGYLDETVQNNETMATIPSAGEVANSEPSVIPEL